MDEEQRRLEIEKGQQMAARSILKDRFDPDPPPETVAGIPFKEWRAQQDRYREIMRRGRNED